MEITLPISSLFIIAIGSIGLVVAIGTAIFLFLKKGDQHQSNSFLAALLFLSGLTLLNEILVSSGITNRFKNLYFIPIFYSLSVAPLYYLLVKSKYYKQIKRLDYLHLLLPLIQALVYLFVGFRSLAFKTELWMSAGFKTYLSIESILFPVGLIFYSLLALSILKKPAAQNAFWQVDLQKWLYSMTKIILIIAILELIVFGSDYFFNYRFAALFYVFRISLFVGFILWIAFNVLKLFFPTSIYTSHPTPSKVRLNQTESEELKLNMLKLMEEDTIFLNPDMSLNLFATYLGTTPKKCSHILRHSFHCNFNQFLNQYRVKAFLAKIDQGKHQQFTLLSLAYESGFDSKSTFNRAFKQIKHTSPSQYIKKLKTEL